MPSPPRTANTLTKCLKVLGRAPLPALHACGWCLGQLLAHTPNRSRQTAEINIARCFPSATPRAQRRLVRQSLCETGKCGFELAAIFTRDPQHTLRWIRTVHGAVHLETAIAAGRSVLLLVPHLGCWELAGLWVAARHRLTALYRPPRQAALEPLLRAARMRNGANLVPIGAHGVRALLRALSRNEVVGILPDQEPDGEEPFAPFFGVPTKTMTLAGRLAERSGATVLHLFALRLPAGRGFELHFIPADSAVAEHDPQLAAAALNRGIEACVRHAPEQYQWTYKRFATQPDGSSPYPRRRRRHNGG